MSDGMFDDDYNASFSRKGRAPANYVENPSDSESAEEGENVDVEMDEAVSSHGEACTICTHGGELLCCDTCSNVYHLACLDPPLTRIPEGSWFCPECEGRVCQVCKEDGGDVQCATCRKISHIKCLDGPVPISSSWWRCSDCLVSIGVDKFVSHRPKEVLSEKEVEKRRGLWKIRLHYEKLAKEHEAEIRLYDDYEEDEDFGPEDPDNLACKICYRKFSHEHNAMIICDGCGTGFHQVCIDLTIIPDGDWYCEQCKYLSGFLESSHKGSGSVVGATESSVRDAITRVENTEAQGKEFYVKLKNMSYLHSMWISEKQAKDCNESKLRNYLKRTALHVDPRLNQEDETNVDTQWMEVDRVIAERNGTRGAEFLIKWKNLPYEECTWEDEQYVRSFLKEIKLFRRRSNGKICKPDPDAERESSGGTFFVQHVSQPSWVTGGTLHSFQLDGVNWLRHNFYHRNNVILGDEMGLGKTIQTVSFLLSLVKEGASRGPFIVVAPLSTIANWEREFHQWAPEMNVLVYHGGAASRRIIQTYEFQFSHGRQSFTSEKANQRHQESDSDGDGDEEVTIGKKKRKLRNSIESKRRKIMTGRLKFDVILTNYEALKNEVDESVLSSIRWQCLVVDEGHRLKGGRNESKTVRVLLDLFKTVHRVLLTGTPLQNNLEELFNLLHFLSPDEFPSVESLSDEFKVLEKEAQLKRLHEMLGPHLLRRQKKNVKLQIGEKKELLVRVELSSVQKECYRQLLVNHYPILNKQSRGKSVPSLMNIVMEMKKCCNHPYLFAGIEPLGLTSDAWFEKMVAASGKLQLLDKMLMKLKERGHRVLIFSQMQRMLDILEDYAIYRRFGYERLDGSVRGIERQTRIDRFNRLKGPDGKFLFLLTTRCGGVGINLTTADTVFIYDSDWNPHNDLQALARAHRIGQQKTVMVYSFVARATVEERIIQTAMKKLLLEHIVIGKKQIGMSQEELNDAIKFGAADLFNEEGDELNGRKSLGEEQSQQKDNATPTNKEATPTGSEPRSSTQTSDGTAQNGAPSKWGDGNIGRRTRVVVWDEEAVERLLDRNIEEERHDEENGSGDGALGEDNTEKNSTGLLQLMDSFKVASFSKLALEEEPERPTNDEDEQLENVLKSKWELNREETFERFGRGRRDRRRESSSQNGQTIPPVNDSADEADSASDQDSDYVFQDGLPKYPTPSRKQIVRHIFLFGAALFRDSTRLKKLLGKPRKGKRARLEEESTYLKKFAEALTDTTLDEETQKYYFLEHSQQILLLQIARIGLIQQKLKEYGINERGQFLKENSSLLQNRKKFFIDDAGITQWEVERKEEDISWGSEQDKRLLAGVLRYGWNKVMTIGNDEELGLAMLREDRHKTWAKKRITLLTDALMLERRLKNMTKEDIDEAELDAKLQDYVRAKTQGLSTARPIENGTPSQASVPGPSTPASVAQPIPYPDDEPPEPRRLSTNRPSLSEISSHVTSNGNANNSTPIAPNSSGTAPLPEALKGNETMLIPASIKAELMQLKENMAIESKNLEQIRADITNNDKLAMDTISQIYCNMMNLHRAGASLRSTAMSLFVDQFDDTKKMINEVTPTVADLTSPETVQDYLAGIEKLSTMLKNCRGLLLASEAFNSLSQSSDYQAVLSQVANGGFEAAVAQHLIDAYQPQ